jgi:formate hydrogenlyase subunit 6/NADH:ubiquinone oxidoreductase subunit I
MSVWALLMNNLRRGTVTLRFPTRPPTCNRYRGLVHINTEPCKCCGICAVVCTSAAITMKKGDGKYEWNYDAGQCTFCGRCVDSCALKLLTMEAAPPPIYETSGALKQSHRWEAKPIKAPTAAIAGSRSPSEPVALRAKNGTSAAEELAK